MAHPLLERLKFSNADRDRVVGLVRHHLICYSSEWSDAAVRRWLRRVTPELAEDLYDLGRADALAKGPAAQGAPSEFANLDQLRSRVQQLLAAGAAVSVRDLAINGRDLLGALGLQPGPLLGEVLRELLEEVTDNPERNTREVLLDRARELAQSKSNASQS
jgi:tRNA nucleotidyltransferase (CCA-adding enzyme)